MKWAVWDLDGVIAEISPEREALQRVKDWEPFHALGCKAEMYPEARLIHLGLLSVGVPSIIMTGRTEPYRKDTLKWLHFRGFEPRFLFMRGAEDRRKNVMVKQEMMAAFQLHHGVKKDDILCIFEDRDEIVAMWRAAGYTCLQPRLGSG